MMLLTGCSSTTPEASSGPAVGRTTSSTLPSAPSSESRKVRVLGCDEQLAPTTPAARSIPHVLGIASDGWVGSPKAAFEHSIATADGDYDGFKTYTYVTKSAAARTSIHMEAPQDGLLFYTSGYRWSQQLTDTQVIEGATRSVTLTGCRPQPAGYAGEFVLKGPACVRLLIVGHRPGADVRRRLAVPMGKQC
jgi:hypothetical protein